ncbi:MAG: hemerythrin domain-containing protein [Candidatus Omnitrophota bacterium]
MEGDPLITVSRAHKAIYEMPNMYEKVFFMVSVFNIAEYVRILKILFTQTLNPHFDFEERKIFPILTTEVPDSRTLILTLIQQHTQFKSKLNEVDDMSLALQYDPQATQQEKDQAAAICKEITSGLNEHAQLEDEKLYPLLKNTSFFK